MSLDLQFDHIGISVESPQADEFWVPTSECWVTNPRTHSQRIEYLRFESKPQFEPRSPLWKLWNMPHIAYRVDDLDKAIEGVEVVYGPFQPADFGRVVFVHEHGMIVEYLEYTDLATWFGASHPGGLRDRGTQRMAGIKSRRSGCLYPVRTATQMRCHSSFERSAGPRLVFSPLVGAILHCKRPRAPRETSGC